MVSDHFYAFILSLFPPGITCAFSYGSAVVEQLDENHHDTSGDNSANNLPGHPNSKTGCDYPHSNGMSCNGNTANGLKRKDSEEPKMLDLVFVVDDPVEWHRENLIRNPGHYSILGLLGPDMIFTIQSKFKAGIYFNVVMSIDIPESVLRACGDVGVHGSCCPKSMKYGVIQTNDFIDDVTNWTNLYVSGRLHKPIRILIPKVTETESKTGHKSSIRYKTLNELLLKNYQSALVTSILLLPSEFTEDELFEKITSLSYLGDFRMIIGEDKNKVSKIVSPSKELFRQIYYPVLDKLSKKFPNHINVSSGMFNITYTIPFLVSLIHVLPSAVSMFIRKNHLKSIQKFKNLSARVSERSIEADIFKMFVTHDVHEAITSIVWKSSLSQGIKGFFTTGFLKAIKYCFRKISKMYHSVRSRSSSPLPPCHRG